MRDNPLKADQCWAPSTIVLAQDLVVETTIGPVHVELREDGWCLRDSDPMLHLITHGLAEGLDAWAACEWLNAYQARLP
jgi:hypothetical protein